MSDDGRIDADGNFGTNHLMPMPWKDMTKEDAVAWAIGGFRLHLLAVLEALEDAGQDLVPVAGFRVYLQSLDTNLNLSQEDMS